MLMTISENSEEPLLEWVVVQYALAKALKETERQTPARVEWGNKAESRTSEENHRLFSLFLQLCPEERKMLSWSLRPLSLHDRVTTELASVEDDLILQNVTCSQPSGSLLSVASFFRTRGLQSSDLRTSCRWSVIQRREARDLIPRWLGGAVSRTWDLWRCCQAFIWVLIKAVDL